MMQNPRSARRGRTFLLFSPLATALLVVSSLSGCGSPSTAPAPAGEAETNAGRTQADTAQADTALAEREAAVRQREADMAAREYAATRPPSTPVQPAAPARPPAERPHQASPTHVASRALAGDGPAAGIMHPTAYATGRVVQVPAGTELQVELVDGLSSGTSLAGQEIAGRLTADVMVDGTVVLPAGSSLTGTVTETVPRKKVGGKALISLNFDHVVLASGQTVAISAPFTEIKSETGKDAATIGGAAVAGAILGHQVSEKHGKLVGAVLGGAAGTAIASKTGQEIELPAGTILAVPLDQGASVSVPR